MSWQLAPWFLLSLSFVRLMLSSIRYRREDHLETGFGPVKELLHQGQIRLTSYWIHIAIDKGCEVTRAMMRHLLRLNTLNVPSDARQSSTCPLL